MLLVNPQFPPSHSIVEDLTAPAGKAFWAERLAQMPSVFARLAYLTSLRHPHRGTYSLPELNLRFGDLSTHRALQATHIQVFWEWLEFNLEEKCADIKLYLSTLPDPKNQVLEHWKLSRPYMAFLPPQIAEGEADLFFSELEALLQLLRAEFPPGT